MGDSPNDDNDNSSKRESDEASRVPGVGDGERENREHIAKTGEPVRDKLGNADGAS